MNEHGFIRSVHRQVVDSVYKWKINDPYQGGVADCYYSGPSGDLWLEYKYLKSLPKRSETLVKFGLTAQQTLWLNQRHAEGRRVGLVVGSPQGHCIFVERAWNEPISMSDFIRSAVATKEVAAYIEKHTTTADVRHGHAEHHRAGSGKRASAQRDLEPQES